MFRGRFEHALDEKGRLSVPSKFRDVLKVADDDRLVITTHDNCLYVYPLKEWEQLEAKMANAEEMADEDIDIMRFLSASAEECTIDKMGRILLKERQRQYAGIQREVVLAGVLRRFEIWDRERFEIYMKSAEETARKSGLARKLGI